MACVLVLSGDLLFGSRVQGALTLAGHHVELIGGEAPLRARLAVASDPEHPPAQALVVDLTDGALDGAGVLESLKASDELGSTRTLAFYSHVDGVVRERAEAAGFDMVVARSRMAREGAELVAGLLERPD